MWVTSWISCVEETLPGTGIQLRWEKCLERDGLLIMYTWIQQLQNWEKKLIGNWFNMGVLNRWVCSAFDLEAACWSLIVHADSWAKDADIWVCFPKILEVAQKQNTELCHLARNLGSWGPLMNGIKFKTLPPKQVSKLINERLRVNYLHHDEKLGRDGVASGSGPRIAGTCYLADAHCCWLGGLECSQK